VGGPPGCSLTAGGTAGSCSRRNDVDGSPTSEGRRFRTAPGRGRGTHASVGKPPHHRLDRPDESGGWWPHEPRLRRTPLWTPGLDAPAPRTRSRSLAGSPGCLRSSWPCDSTPDKPVYLGFRSTSQMLDRLHAPSERAGSTGIGGGYRSGSALSAGGANSRRDETCENRSQTTAGPPRDTFGRSVSPSARNLLLPAALQLRGWDSNPQPTD
jgi:hypothetical protein